MKYFGKVCILHSFSISNPDIYYKDKTGSLVTKITLTPEQYKD